MALRNVNLLPWDVLEKTILLRHVRFWAKGLMLVVLILAVCFYVQHRWTQGYEQNLAISLSSVDQVAEKIDEISRLQEKIKAISSKHKALSAIARRQVFYDVIAVFSGCLNEQTWINRLSIDRNVDESDKSILVCEGTSLDHRALGFFLDRLSAVTGVEGVVLNKAVSLEGDTQFPGSVHFKISCAFLRRSGNETPN